MRARLNQVINDLRTVVHQAMGNQCTIFPESIFSEMDTNFSVFRRSRFSDIRQTTKMDLLDKHKRINSSLTVKQFM